MSFNKTHPEIQKGERFLTNCANKHDYSHIGWALKRKGKQAYDVKGNPISYLFLVFVNKAEWEHGMKSW